VTDFEPDVTKLGVTVFFKVQLVATAVKTATRELTLVGNYSAGKTKGGWRVTFQSITLP
jgi:hypothetical protein